MANKTTIYIKLKDFKVGHKYIYNTRPVECVSVIEEEKDMMSIKFKSLIGIHLINTTVINIPDYEVLDFRPITKIEGILFS